MLRGYDRHADGVVELLYRLALEREHQLDHTGHAVLCAVSLRFGGGFGHVRLFRRRSFGRGGGESAGTEGYALFSGTWDGVTPDDASNVYVLSGGALYEAVPRPDGVIVSIDAVYAAAGGNFSRLSAVYAID